MPEFIFKLDIKIKCKFKYKVHLLSSLLYYVCDCNFSYRLLNNNRCWGSCNVG